MCEFCGCEMEWPVEHPLQQRQPKGKALGVRVKAAPAEPKFPAPFTTDLREKPRTALEELTAEHV
ncbi:MAG: hypothetical protein HYU73_00740 [Betaproteobacteria bacterium]|nr:hypothetical protein [Betaproteobacteria bacterium]